VSSRISSQDERTVRLSQAEVGRLANVSRKLVNRSLQRFAASAAFTPRYGAVQILDMQGLKHFAAGTRL
jgi:CRP/FNR family cyclic AMP-dependent transcriptional regulator